MRDNALKRSERRYNDNKENEIVPINIKTSFRLKKSNRIRDDQKQKLIYESLLPSLFRLINKKIFEQKEDEFNRIKIKVMMINFVNYIKDGLKNKKYHPKKN